MKRAAKKPTLAAVPTTRVVTHPEMNDEAHEMIAFLVAGAEGSDACVDSALSQLADDVLTLRYAMPTGDLSDLDVASRLEALYLRILGLQKLERFERNRLLASRE